MSHIHCIYFIILLTGYNLALDCSTNEVEVSCETECPTDKCPTSDDQEKACTKPEICPSPICKCQFNYRRAENGSCIPTRQCPAFDCTGPNEEYNPCPPLCPNGDCSQATPDGRCPLIFGNIGIVLECTPECRCIKNYWRKNRMCVPYEECLN